MRCGSIFLTSIFRIQQQMNPAIMAMFNTGSSQHNLAGGTANSISISIRRCLPIQRLIRLCCQWNRRIGNSGLGFRIYPNPASGKITLSFSQPGNYEVKILDELGREVQSLLVNQESKISIQELPSGVYFLEVKVKILSR